MDPSQSEIDELYNLIGMVASYEDDNYLELLFESIERLLQKYGESPVLLSTKADFIDDIDERLKLYNRVIELSENPIQPAYITQSAESILCIYIEELSDYENSKYWLEKLKELVELYGDRYLINNFIELQAMVENLKRKVM